MVETIRRKIISASILALLLGAAIGCSSSSDKSSVNRPKTVEKTSRFVFNSRLGPYRYWNALNRGGSFKAAIASFGEPTSKGTTLWQQSNLCTVRWRRFGLEIDFASQLNPCSAVNLAHAAWYGMRLFSDRWLIDKGLRVGDGLAKLRKLYPTSRFVDRPPEPPTYWLRKGKNEAGVVDPLLTAEVWDGRVVSITVEPGYIY